MSDNQKKKSAWDLELNILKEFDNSENYKKNASQTIKNKVQNVNNLFKKARTLYKEGNFIDSSKVFRQLATFLRELEFSIEEKGNYHEKNNLNDLTGKEWLRHTKSWIVVDGKPSDIPSEIKDHPASYPPDLARHFIEYFTKKGDWVFDPFMGIGSTLAAAKEIQRNCWGTELNPKYAEYAQARIKDKIDLSAFDKNQENFKYQVHNQDCREAFEIWEKENYPKIKFILTSPPYWNMLEKSRGGVTSALKQRVAEGFDQKYSDDARDLGNISSMDAYLDAMCEIFKSFIPMMAPGGYMMIILQNIRPKDGIMRPIAWEFAIRLSKILDLRQEFIWLQDQKFMGIWGYLTTYVSNVHHHYCLVLQPKKE